jgi:hypothetical protein
MRARAALGRLPVAVALPAWVPAAVAVALLACLPAAAAAADWELIDDVEGVQVWAREVPGSPLVAFRGEGSVDVPVARLLGVMVDPARGPRWVQLLTESTWLRVLAENEVVLYTRYDSPWPLQDRDYVLHRVIEVDPLSRTVTSTLRSIEDPAMPAQECCIRGFAEHTVWRFTDLGLGRTRVQVEVATDPRGSVPDALVRLFQRSWPRRSILSLAQEARSPDVVPWPPVANW